MAEKEDPFISLLKIRNQTSVIQEVPLLNTQTCLRDPYIGTSEGEHIRMSRGRGGGG